MFTLEGMRSSIPIGGISIVWNALIKIKDRRNDAVQVAISVHPRTISEVNLHSRLKTIIPFTFMARFVITYWRRWRVESIYGAEYQAQCWTLGLTVEDKNRSPDGTQKKELKFQVYFNLLELARWDINPIL